jgi:MEMO1 family protein
MNERERFIGMVGLMPHAPVLIPEVGGGREGQASKSVEALRELSARMLQFQPDRTVLISPHSPRRLGSFGVWAGARLEGTLAPFGCPQVGVDLKNDEAFIRALKLETEACAVSVEEIPVRPLDHGAIVPLYFLTEAGWNGATVVLGLNYPGEGGLAELGRCIAAAAEECGGRTVVIASGDMSHRLKPGGPAGYHPEARTFDETFVAFLRQGQYDLITSIDPSLQELAAEDVVDSTLVALASVEDHSTNHEVLSYEGPFGVGYCVAVLYEAPVPEPAEISRRNPAPSEMEITVEGQRLPALARQVVAAHLQGQISLPPEVEPGGSLAQRRGVFVTIRTREGELRGCKGNLEPYFSNLMEETRAVALSSAFNDGRFRPVGSGELDELLFEVSVLHPLEPVRSPAELDPKTYGILVRAADGRQAVMLPDVAGLDTVELQMNATLHKAGIAPDGPVNIFRFRVDKFSEPIEDGLQDS